VVASGPDEPPRPRPAPVSIDPSWRRGLHTAQRTGRALGRSAGQRWRSSLQTRVVVTTLVVSSLVVALFISLLLESVGRGLVEAKTRTALGEARSGVVTVEGDPRLLSEELTDPEQVSRLEDVFEDLARRAAGSDYRVLLVGGRGNFSSGGVGDEDVPERLVERLDARQVSAYVFAPVPAGSSDSSLVVGSPVRLPQQLGEYRLFHVFPLTAERQTLSLVRSTATVSGVLLVGLLALITGLVARQVVVPVREAARTAARLASGRLDERLTVRGEDEIARLGSSFNSMADALQSQIRLLEDLSRVQRRFVSDVSHELRTPLTTVRMAADVLFDAREDFPAGASRSAELLQAELDRFEALLADLLEISRYDAGAADLDVSATDLCPVVRRVLAAAAPLAARHGSRFDLHLPARPVVADVEQVRIERVLRNLVVNAVEHGEGRPVEVALEADDDKVVVTVRDHGVGLQPGQAGMVFTRFWRGDPSRARTTGGTGLGLAIALEDVRLHGGWLQAAGAPGRGSVFRMTLPRAAGRAVPDTPLEPPP
jgi:two-component system sensor histidine kinase MtrB